MIFAVQNKINMKTILISLSILISSSIFAQEIKSQGILDKLSNKIKAYNSFYIEFSSTFQIAQQESMSQLLEKVGFKEINSLQLMVTIL